jgi:UDP-glucuronate decarboxylase
LDGDPLTVYGDGKQTRSFCYVDDMVDGLVRMADTDDDTVGPVNLGNPTETTIGTLAATIADIAGVDLATVYRPLPVDDPRQRCPDITRAREWLGWQPTTLLRDGLTATIDTARLDHAMHRLRSYL